MFYSIRNLPRSICLSLTMGYSVASDAPDVFSTLTTSDVNRVATFNLDF